ncbi:MAG: hypothetical protein H7318_10695 [Oligoflexus sp.]|nr:hypothetical protein [Oligoflexus sp.]
MMRYVSLCLVVLTVACGPSNDSSSDLQSRPAQATSELSSPVLESKDYPIAADPSLTPGVRCTHPDEMRYPEHIAYCTRSVSKGKKDQVIRAYDDLGYRLEELSRSKIKIDHYIPLCMGGDNAKTNLWPQYEAVYSRTDALEAQLCLALSRGIITQDESIEKMLYAKAHLQETGTILAAIKALL